LVVSLCHTECSRSNTQYPQPSTVMLCQSVLGSFWSVIPGLVTPGTPPLHLSQCSSRSTYITSPHQYYTNLHLNTVFPLDHSTFVWSVSLPAHVWTQSVPQHFHHLHVNAFCGSHSETAWSIHSNCMCHVTSECVSVCVMLILNVSCSPEYIMWSRTCHLWMRHVTVLHVIQRNTHTHASVSWNYCESPISPQSLTCSLQRVTHYPTIGLLPYLLLLTCRLQWVPTPLHLEF